MKPISKLVISFFVFLLVLPIAALSQSRWDDRGWNRDYSYSPINSRDDAFRAGYNEGRRVGINQARNDLRFGLRFNDRTPDLDRYSYGFNPRFRNDFRKGFKKGYREGYSDAYRGLRGRRW